MPPTLSHYPAILLDLDGTLFKDEHPLPGATALISHFNATNRPYACLTNHTFSSAAIAHRLHRMGLPINPAHIYTAGDAAADLVLRHTFSPPDRKPRVFNLATDSFHAALDPHVTWANSPDDPCDVVVNAAPLSTHATPDRQRSALELLKRNPHCALLGICADRLYPSTRGLELGVGALTHSLAYAANVTPTFTGKPQPTFFHTLCDRLHVAPADCLLIGDNPESDIAGAKSVGMPTCLTLTGVTRQQDLPHLPSDLRPDHTIPTLEHLLP